MKITDLNENIALDEFNLGITRKGREIKRASKIAKTALGDEARQMEVELAVWMKHSGLKSLTVDDLQNYFGQKGLGDTARKILSAMPAKAEKKAAKAQAKAQAKAAKLKAKQDAQAQRDADAQSMSGVMVASMYEAQPDTVLTRREVKNAIRLVLQAAYRAQAGFGKSKFAGKK